MTLRRCLFGGFCLGVASVSAFALAVIPAKAAIHFAFAVVVAFERATSTSKSRPKSKWIPAFAGMTTNNMTATAREA